MRQFLQTFLIIVFFGVAAFSSSCSKRSTIVIPTEQEHTPATPVLVTNGDSSSIPDINTENIPDLRSIGLGTDIFKASYVEQPGIVQLADSSWVCVFTTGTGAEGAVGQHVMSTRSTDLGKTWGKAVDIEPATGPAASWAIPYVTSYGRIYAFYDYNGDNFSKVINGSLINVSLLGWYCYKYSDDMGKTWSKRFRIPIRQTSVDKTNTFGGSVQMFWGICKPLHTDRGMLFTFTKMGQFLSGKEEGWLINCPNIETEKEADNLQWKMLPDGDLGIKNPAWSLQEEHNIVQLSNGSLYCVNRTQQGYPAFSTSSDFGYTWTVPTAMRYGNGTAADRVMKQPVACARIFKCRNGNYLLWYHNNGTTAYENRNPVWVAGGVEVNGTIWWSEPELMLYNSTTTNRYSYPDLTEQGGRYFFAESSKTAATVHEISPAFLNDLWYQRKRRTTISNGLLLDYTKNTGTSPANSNLFTQLSTKGGFTLDFTLKFNNLGTVNQIFSNMDSKGKGIKIATTANKTILLTINDGATTSTLETDLNLLAVNTVHHVAFVVDGATGIITAMVDGKLCDGGTKGPFGWVRFGAVNNVNTTSQLVFGSDLDGQITHFKIYGRALRTSELVSSYMAAK